MATLLSKINWKFWKRKASSDKPERKRKIANKMLASAGITVAIIILPTTLIVGYVAYYKNKVRFEEREATMLAQLDDHMKLVFKHVVDDLQMIAAMPFFNDMLVAKKEIEKSAEGGLDQPADSLGLGLDSLALYDDPFAVTEDPFAEAEDPFAALGELIVEEAAPLTDEEQARATLDSLEQMLSQTRAEMDSRGITPEERLGLMREKIQQTFIAFLVSRPEFRELSFLNLNGEEEVRVLREGKAAKVVAQEDLRNQAASDFYILTNLLPEGVPHVSRMTLYEEGRVVAVPFQPILTYTYPVFNRQKTRLGMVAITMDGQPFLDEVEALEEELGSIYLLDNAGNYLYHSVPDHTWGEDLETGEGLHKDNRELAQMVLKGMAGRLDMAGNYCHYHPIFPLEGFSDYYWVALREVPKSLVLNPVYQLVLLIVGLGLFFLAVSLLIAKAFARQISKPLERLVGTAQLMSRDQISDTIVFKSNDEMSVMLEAFNTLNRNRGLMVEFADQIALGNYDAPVLFDSQGRLGQSLIKLRDSLKQALQEQAKRREDDERRGWATQGMAKFSEILRKAYQDSNEMGYAIISELVHYLGANQGGLFLHNEDEANPLLEMRAAFAFDRQKFLKKEIMLGEGLVGAVAKERKTTHLTEIPPQYIQITSGLGDAPPDSLLIVPLMTDDKLLGVLELASFGPFAPHAIQFVEQVAESIASTLSTSKINERTSLLLEQSRRQAQEMSEQEEEMRQNMEELQATQEENNRKQREMEQMTKRLQREIRAHQDEVETLRAENRSLRERLGEASQDDDEEEGDDW